MWVVGKITLGNYSLSALNVLLQLVPIILEGATVVMIYYFAKKYASDAISALLALVYAVLPVMFTLSGGYDVEVPVLVFLLFVTFYALTEKDFVMLLILFAFNIKVSAYVAGYFFPKFTSNNSNLFF